MPDVETMDEDAVREDACEKAEQRREDEAAADAGRPAAGPEPCGVWPNCVFNDGHPGVCRDYEGAAAPAQRKAAKAEEREEQAAVGSVALERLAAVADADLPGPTGRMIPGTGLTIVPGEKEMAGLAAMAVTLSAANAVPPAIRGRPNDVFLVLLTARDLGVSITTAIREFHVIDGRVTLSPKSKLAMVNERGAERGWAIWPNPGNDAEVATWHAIRADRPGIEYAYSFTIADARTAGLAGKDNWKGYPKRMLSWRALGYLLDDVFPEVGTGLYSPDEMGAVTDADGNPVIDVNSMEPLMGMRAPGGSNRGGGGAAKDEIAPEEEREALRVRLDALRPEHFNTDPTYNGPTAREVVLQLWQAKDADGNTREGGVPLPAIPYLTVGMMKRAVPIVRGVEDRARKGEWGEWAPPADPETGEVTDPATSPGSDGPPATSEAPPETASEPAATTPTQSEEPPEPDTAADTPAAAEPEPTGPDPDRVQAIIDQVAAMGDGERKAALAARSLSPTGPKNLQQQRLAEALLVEAMQADAERAGGSGG